MRFPPIENVTFEQTAERLKVVLPVQRQWPYLLVYSALMLLWLGATAWMLVLLFNTSRGQMSTLFLIVWALILLLWAYVWYRLGRFVWRWWQYFAADREILFVSPTTLIVRRPISLLGVTDAYDMEHVSAFYYNEKNRAIGFDYGSRGALFGQSLERPVAQQLITVLNRNYFPHALEDEDEEDGDD